MKEILRVGKVEGREMSGKEGELCTGQGEMGRIQIDGKERTGMEEQLGEKGRKGRERAGGRKSRKRKERGRKGKECYGGESPGGGGG